ncbi:unnamed protein product [Symbiodinium sp. KB8]|nr:unnamed protein product [Symbiodinium sp. KB8]
MNQMNAIPDPAVNQTENETGKDANATKAEEPEGLGGLGRTLEFMMLKITQLETLAEVQQAEIVSLRKHLQEHLNADHTDSKVALVQKDPDAHMEEIQATMKGVIKKHAHQLKHREFHSKARAASQAELLEKRQKTTKADAASLESSLSSKIPIVDDAIDFVEDRVEDVKDGTGLVGDALGNAYDSAKDKIDFVARTTIDSVQMAMDILVRGFTDWNAWLVAGSAYEAVRTVFSVGWELMHCPHRGHHHQLIACLGGWVQHLAPAVHWMAAPLQLVAGSAYEAVRTVFSVGWELMHCPHRGHHHQLIQCLGGWIQHFAPPLHWMPNPVKALANGQIMSLLPGQLNQIASGDIMGLLPGQLNQIASGNIMGLMPGQLNQIASGDIMGLLPGQLNQIASGNIMGLMPGPMQLLGGGQTNSIQNMLTLGNALMKCSDSQQQDLVQCLGFQIVGTTGEAHGGQQDLGQVCLLNANSRQAAVSEQSSEPHFDAAKGILPRASHSHFYVEVIAAALVQPDVSPHVTAIAPLLKL